MERHSKPTVSVVLSFYNEENVLRELIRRLRAVLSALQGDSIIAKYELIFVDDSSTDRSAEILRDEFAANDLVIVTTSRNFGVSECVLAGIEQSRGDVVIYMDADLQDPPELIPRLIEEWLKDDEVEVVYTVRTKREGEHPLKMLLTKVGYRVIRTISDIDLPVDAGDFKLLSRRAVNELLKLREQKPYLRGLVSWIGFKQTRVQYRREARFDGRRNTKFPVLSKRVVDGYLDRALISFSDAPLKFALYAGFLISTISLLYLIVIVMQKILGLYEPGWPSLMFAILFLGGVQCMLLGFVGLYINTIFRETKRRPNYIIKEVQRPAALVDPEAQPNLSSVSSAGGYGR